MVDRDCVSTKGTVQTFSDGADLDWTAIVSANLGLTVQWAPPGPSAWLVDFIKNSVTIAVGFIPVIGPIAAVAFPLAFTAITEPAKFESTLRSTLPQFDLAKHIEHQLKKTTSDQRSYLPDSWKKSIEAGGGLFAPVTKVPGTSDPALFRAPVPAPPVIEPKPTTRPTAVPDAKQSPRPKEEATVYSVPLPKPKQQFSMAALKRRLDQKKTIRDSGQDIQPGESINQVKESDITPNAPQRIIILNYSQTGQVVGDTFEGQDNPNLEAPERIPLSGLVTSAQFQLADRILRRSGEGSAFTSDTTGFMDDQPEQVIEERFPKNPPVPDTSVPENDYSWMEDYLYDLWFGSEEQTDETEANVKPDQGTEMRQEAEAEEGL